MKCLLIGKVWPEPSSTAAGRRICDVIEALQSAGHTVCFASAAQKGEHALDLGRLDVLNYLIRVNDPEFDVWLKELSPEVVIFDRFMTEEQFAWRVETVLPEAVRILETSDLHCLREARHQQLKNGGALELKNAVALREIASIMRSDGTLMISEPEIGILRKTFSVDPDLLFYWPFAMKAPALESSPTFEARSHFMMIGSFMHAPNLDAARWCRDAVWPLIRQELPDAELHLYGSYGDKYASELHAPKKGFLFKGRAQDALQTMTSYRVNLAPLRFGAGLKGKVFDGFATGTPTVTTPIGAEGIAAVSEWGCSITDDADALAKTAVAVYANADLWSQVQTAGQQIVHARFTREQWLPKLAGWLELIVSQKESRREHNFTGRMLRHHQHRSTEYMSRWIEAKNRLL